MTLILDLPSDIEMRLKEEADRSGMDAARYALDLLREDLAIPRHPVSQMLAQWRSEDATDDPEEIHRAEEELAEFKRQMNANRAGEEPFTRLANNGPPLRRLHTSNLTQLTTSLLTQAISRDATQVSG